MWASLGSNSASAVSGWRINERALYVRGSVIVDEKRKGEKCTWLVVRFFWIVTPCGMVTGYQATRSHMPEDSNLNIHCHEKFIFHALSPTDIVRLCTGIRHGALCRIAGRCEHCDESFECRKSADEGMQVFFFSRATPELIG